MAKKHKKPQLQRTDKGKQTEVNNPMQIIQRNICPASAFVSALLFGFGAQAMSIGSEIAPWLMAFAALMIALAILTSQDVWNFVNRLSNKLAKAVICVVVCAVFFVPVLITFQHVASHQREVLSNTLIFNGELTPGNEPNPVSSVPPNATTLIMGDNVVFAAQSENHIFSQGNSSFLSIGISADGSMTLNARVLDSTGNRVVTIYYNEFRANPDYAFTAKQPDHHTLVVRDFDDVEVLNIDI